MDKPLETRVKERGFTAQELLITMGVFGIVAAIAMPGLMKYLPKTEQKKEYIVSYESPHVRQLCDSALKKAGPLERQVRIREMDYDKDEVITEAEVFKYVRENYAKLR